MRDKIVQAFRSAHDGLRVSGLRPTGMLATRALVVLLLVPLLLLVIEYIVICCRGYVNYDAGRIIDVGIKVIGALYLPAVPACIVAFLNMTRDDNHNNIPDVFEKKNTPDVLEKKKEEIKNDRGN